MAAGQNVFAMRRDEAAERGRHVSERTNNSTNSILRAGALEPNNSVVSYWPCSRLLRAAPRDGAMINGLILEGARWDVTASCIVESIPKELFPIMPVIHLKAIIKDKQDLRNVYECPVYKTKQRGPTYVWTFNLKTRLKSSKWVLAGVAILLSV